MADQSRPIPVNNEEVVEIVQALQSNADNATNNHVSEAASASSGPTNSQQDSTASRQDSVDSQAPVNSEKTGELITQKELCGENYGLIFLVAVDSSGYNELVVDVIFIGLLVVSFASTWPVIYARMLIRACWSSIMS